MREKQCGVFILIGALKVSGTIIAVKHLGQRYVQYVNRTYRRSGTLWEGRFRSCLTQHEHYVLACYRYIELNPVRAHIVSHPRDYRWSSYRANAEGRTDTLLTPHPEYRRLGRGEPNRLIAYRQLLTAHLRKPINQHSPTRQADWRTGVRVRANERDGSLNFGDKRFAQTGHS